MLAGELGFRYTNILETKVIKNKLKLDCFGCGIEYWLVCLPNPLLYPFHWSAGLPVNGKLTAINICLTLLSLVNGQTFGCAGQASTCYVDWCWGYRLP